MFTISTIRERARQTLNETSGSFQIALIPVLISVLVQLISTSRNTVLQLTAEELTSPSYLFSSSLFPIFYSLLLGLLYLSISWSLFHIIKGRKDAASFKDALTIFNHKDFGKIFSTFILKSFLLFLWGLVLYIGVGMVIGSSVLVTLLTLSTNLANMDMASQNFLVTLAIVFLIGLLLILVGAIIYIPQVYAYSQVDYILLEQLDREDYTSAFSIIKSSRKLMKGYKFKRFVLDLSFLGWFILVGITFGLAGLYVWPYYYAAQVHFHEGILDDQAQKMDYLYQ